MANRSLKVALLIVLTCIFAFLFYQNNIWKKISIPIPVATTFKAVDKTLLEQFNEESRHNESIANRISQFLNLEPGDLKKIRKSYYGDWKKSKHIKNEKYYSKVPGIQYDYIFLPALVLENETLENYEFKLPNILYDEVLNKRSKSALKPANAKNDLGGNHRIFDIPYARKLAAKYDAKVVYTLNKINLNTKESDLLFIIADSSGTVIGSKEIHFTSSNINEDVMSMQSWTLAQVELSKESIYNECFREKFETISDYAEDFFLLEEKGMDGECNATRIGNWEQAEINRSLQFIEDKKYDILVLPIQEREPRTDRVGRLLSSRLIAHEIEKQTGMNAAIPFLGHQSHFNFGYWFP